MRQGQLFPSDEPRATQSEGERAVWRALAAQLPEGWRAWHSLRIKVGGGWEGEGDFVVADPERGLLVLEVKGGVMELRGGHWHQNGSKLKRPPKEQARKYVGMLCDARRAPQGSEGFASSRLTPGYLDYVAILSSAESRRRRPRDQLTTLPS